MAGPAKDFFWIDQLLELMESPSCLLFPNLKVLSANTPFLKTFGLTGEDCLGQSRQRPLFELIPSVKYGEALNSWRRQPLSLPGFEECALYQSSAFDSWRSEIKNRETLLLMASHEMRTPLTSTRLLMQLISRLLLKPSEILERPERVHQLVQDTLYQVDYAVRTLEVFLEVSRIQEGRLKPRLAPVDFSATVQAAIKTVCALSERQLTRIHFTPQKGVFVSGDPDQLQCAVVNILANAIKYGGGKKVGIFFEDRNSQIRTHFVDEGNGAQESQKIDLFAPLVRGPSAEKGDGFGLGLYVVRLIAELHGGGVHFESTDQGKCACVLVLSKASGD